MTKIFDVIQHGKYLYVIDKQAKLDIDQYRYCFHDKGIWKMSHANSSCPDCCKIVASNNPDLGNIPRFEIKEDENRLAEEYIKSDPDFKVEGLSPFQNGKFIGFADGYKAAFNSQYVKDIEDILKEAISKLNSLRCSYKPFMMGYIESTQVINKAFNLLNHPRSVPKQVELEYIPKIDAGKVIINKVIY